MPPKFTSRSQSGADATLAPTIADSTLAVAYNEHRCQPRFRMCVPTSMAWRVGDTRVMIESVIIPFTNGDSPELIRSQYPSLTLEQIYGAITYYLANRQQVDDYLRRQEAAYRQTRAEREAMPDAIRDRLRALKAGLEAERGR